MAKQTSNVFSPSIYDTCLTEECGNQTQHKSGKCEQCRTKTCISCKKTMVFSKDFDTKRPMCAYCKVNRKKSDS